MSKIEDGVLFSRYWNKTIHADTYTQPAKEAFYEGLKIGREDDMGWKGQSIHSQSEITSLKLEIAKLSEEKGALVERLEEAEMVIEFYASNDSWVCSSDRNHGDAITIADMEVDSNITKRKYVGGLKAREYLQKYSTYSGAGEV